MLRVEPVPGAERESVDEVALDYMSYVERRSRPLDLRLIVIQQRFDPALDIVLRTGDGIRQHFGEGIIGLKRQIPQPSPHIELQSVVGGIAVISGKVRGRRNRVGEK